MIVEQRKKIVYVNEMVEASEEPVCLVPLMAVYGDPEQVGDWEERAGDLATRGAARGQ